MLIRHGSQQVLFTRLEQTVAAEHLRLQNNKEANEPIIIIFFAWQYELTQQVSGLPTLNDEKPTQHRLALVCSVSAHEFLVSLCWVLEAGTLIRPRLTLMITMLFWPCF